MAAAAAASQAVRGSDMAIGRRIAELHGATLTVQSPADEGATFIFTLPAENHGSR